MEILFMVFMVVVSIMALFAVMVVLRDIVREILAERRERDNRNNTVAEAERVADSTPVAEPAIVSTTVTPDESVTAAEPVAVEEAVVTDTPVEASAETTDADASDSTEATEVVTAEPVAAPTEDAEGTISFSMAQQQTLEERYFALPAAQRRWYDEIVKYASAVEGSKRFKSVRYEEYKVGKNRIVRVLIKRGIIHCEFILHNSDFKNYINENKISVRQSATTILVESAATVEVVKNSIDIVVAAIAEERAYKKKLARERRRVARASETPTEATEATEATETKTEAPVGV